MTERSEAREAVTRVQEALRRRATSRAPPQVAPTATHERNGVAQCARGRVPPFGIQGGDSTGLRSARRLLHVVVGRVAGRLSTVGRACVVVGGVAGE